MSLRQLRAPARDAADLSEVLSDPQIGGFLVTQVVDRSAQEIRLAVEEFVTDRAPDDILVVYLSGHGLVDPRRRLYFAATDTLKSRLAATGVESAWLLQQMEDCRARRQVIILDCCFSGAFAHGAKGEPDLGLGERFHGHGRGRVVLTASRASEYSFEGEPLSETVLPGSVFTSALVAGLRTGAADADNDGYIYVDDAYTYAFDQILREGANQTPQRWLYGAEGRILLARSPAGITIEPAALPESLRIGLDSPHPSIRLGAIAVLGEWLTDLDPARVLAARHTLEQVAETDVAPVAAAAAALLGPITGEARNETVGEPAPASRRPFWSLWSPWSRTGAVASGVDLVVVVVLLVAVVTMTMLIRSPGPDEAGGWGGGGRQGSAGLTYYGMAFSPDGRTMASGGGDGAVRLWDLTRQQPKGKPLDDRQGGVRSVAFSGDGKTLASGDQVSTVRLWDVETHRLKVALRTDGTSRSQPAVRSVALSRYGETLAWGSGDGRVGLWNVATREPGELPEHEGGAVLSLAFSPDGRTLASGSEDGNVRLWDVARQTPKGQPFGGRAAVWSVAFRDNTTLASGGGDSPGSGVDEDYAVRLWNAVTRKSVGLPLSGHSDVVMALAFSPDGKTLASGSADSIVRRWNVATQRQIGVLTTSGVVRSVAYSPDGQVLACATSDGTVQQWSPAGDLLSRWDADMPSASIGQPAAS